MVIWCVIGAISFLVFKGVISIPGLTPAANTSVVLDINATSNTTVDSALQSYYEFKNRPSSYVPAKEIRSGGNAIIGWSSLSIAVLIFAIYAFFNFRMHKSLWRWWKSHFERLEEHYKKRKKK